MLVQATSQLVKTARQLVYSYALAWMPLGFAVWLSGMHLRSYAIAVTGFLLSVLGAFAWTDDSRDENLPQAP